VSAHIDLDTLEIGAGATRFARLLLVSSCPLVGPDLRCPSSPFLRFPPVAAYPFSISVSSSAASAEILRTEFFLSLDNRQTSSATTCNAGRNCGVVGLRCKTARGDHRRRNATASAVSHPLPAWS